MKKAIVLFFVLTFVSFAPKTARSAPLPAAVTTAAGMGMIVLDALFVAQPPGPAHQIQCEMYPRDPSVPYCVGETASYSLDEVEQFFEGLVE